MPVHDNSHCGWKIKYIAILLLVENNKCVKTVIFLGSTNYVITFEAAGTEYMGIYQTQPEVTVYKTNTFLVILLKCILI